MNQHARARLLAAARRYYAVARRYYAAAPWNAVGDDYLFGVLLPGARGRGWRRCRAPRPWS